MCVRETPAVALCETPAAAFDYWNKAVAPHIDPEKEHLVVLLLNTRHHIKGHVIVGMGTLNSTLTSPREVFRPAIVGAAFAIILMHNHPSGDPTPSDCDRRITRQISEVAKLMMIPLRDHVIAGNPALTPPGTPAYFSFREAGLI